MVLQILQNCRSAMPFDGRLLIIESLMGPPNTLGAGQPANMTFLLTFKGGRMRTEEEHERLLQDPGFRLQKNWPAEAAGSVLAAGAA